jgi:predicted secreted protein
MTDARIGYGSTYEIYTGGEFVQVGEVTVITPGAAAGETVDATHMQSPGRRREKIPGMIDSGEASFEINWVPGDDTDELIRGLLSAGTISEHRITFPNGITVTYDAAITGFGKALPIDDKMSATITVAVSGDETWGAAAAPANSVLPAISGLLTNGATLTAYEGKWSGAPTFTYQWKNAGVNIGGATSKTYVIQASDSGDALTVAVTGTNGAGNASATSAPVTAA